MNKQYYNDILNHYIHDLIQEKEKIVDKINEISATFEYHGEIPKNLDLTSNEIISINFERGYLGAIYQLIDDLEKLQK